MAFLKYATGEFLLEKNPNGSGIITLRSLIITFLLYFFSLSILILVDETKIFSVSNFRKTVVETFPWIGAIFGTSYIAFYSRFASQWTYLADLYNKQMSVGITLDQGCQSSTCTCKNKDSAETTYTNWKAAFVEDAKNMHLATKSGFNSLVLEYLDDEKVFKALTSENHFTSIELEKFKSDVHHSVFHN